jgi:DNA topoisomerase-2
VLLLICHYEIGNYSIIAPLAESALRALINNNKNEVYVENIFIEQVLKCVKNNASFLQNGFKKEDLKSMIANNELETILKLTDSKNTNYSNMHLYNNKGIICKYDINEDILKEFYFIRLAYYVKRKEYMLKSMKKELDIYQAKVRFIEEFISGEINILHKEDEEIEALLIERNYPKFGSGDIDEEIDSDKFSYDYLLNMKIKSLTKKKVEELKKLYENKIALYNELEAKTEKDLWKEDLNKFLEVYRKRLAIYNEKMKSNIKNAVVKATKKKGGK